MQTSPVYRMKDEIVTALAGVPGVRRIASFGSVAVGRADRWSDLDLFVVCADVDHTAWYAVAAIRSAKPVLFYRMFTGVPQPSGRYWFSDETPFTRLDVSFYTASRLSAVMASEAIRLQCALSTFATPRRCLSFWTQSAPQRRRRWTSHRPRPKRGACSMCTLRRSNRNCVAGRASTTSG
jgi:hypothetical protein